MKILGVFFGVIDVQWDNWELKFSKLNKMLTLWKWHLLSMVGKSLTINVLGVSKLLYLSRVLVTPRWVIDCYNSLIWTFSGDLRLSLLPVRPPLSIGQWSVLGL